MSRFGTGFLRDDNGALVVTGSGQAIYDSGTNYSVLLGTPATGQQVQVQAGSLARPDTTLNPALKVARTVSLASAAITGDGAEQCASIVGVSAADAANQVQTVGLLGEAQNFGTTRNAPISPDACGVYGIGEIGNSGVGVAIGGFFNARMEAPAALGSSLQVNVRNDTGADNTLNLTGFPTSCAAWLTTNGTNRAGVGIAFGNPFGQQYDFGIHFNAQVAGGLTGPTKTCDIRSDSNAARGIFLNGTYSSTAIAVGSTAGTTLLGGSTAAAAAGCLLEVQAPATNVNPLVSIGSTVNNNAYRVKLRNSVGNVDWFVSAGANNVLTGTIAGDTGLAQITASTSLHLGGTASVIKVGQDNRLGFNNATAIAKPTVTGAKGSNAALGSLLTALASYGLITDSTSA